MTTNKIKFIGPVYPYGRRTEPGNAFIANDTDHCPWNKRPHEVAYCRSELTAQINADGSVYLSIEETTQVNEGGRMQSRTLTFSMPADMLAAIAAHKYVKLES